MHDTNNQKTTCLLEQYHHRIDTLRKSGLTLPKASRRAFASFDFDQQSKIFKAQEPLRQFESIKACNHNHHP